MNQLAPAFHGASQSIAEMNAAIAFQTKLMPSQRMSAAALARMMEMLQRLALHPQPGFEKMAKEITDFRGNLRPLHDIIGIIIRDMDKMQPGWTGNTTAINNFWKASTGTTGQVQSRRAFQSLIQNFTLYEQTLQQIGIDQKEFARSRDAMMKSGGAQWQQFINDLRVLGLEIGSIVLPAFLRMGKVIQHVVVWFHNLSPETRHAIGMFGLLTAALALVGGTLLSITTGIALFVLNMRVIGLTMGTVGTEVGTAAQSVAVLGTEAASLSSKLVLVLRDFSLWVGLFYVINTQTHSLTKTLHYMSYVVLVFMIGKLIILIQRLREAATVMIALQAATVPEIAALVLISYGLAKLIDMIPGVDSGMRKAFQGSSAAIDTTKEKVKEMQIQLDQMHPPEWVRKGIQPKINEERWLGNLKHLQETFANLPGWAIRKIKLTIDPSEMKKIQDQITRFVQNTQPLPGTTDVGMPRAVVEDRLKQMFPFLDDKTIESMANKAYKSLKAAQSQFTEASRMANFGVYSRSKMGGTTAAMTTKEFLDAVQEAAKLKKAQENPPNLVQARLAWLAYNNFVAQVTDTMTKSQKKMFDDLVQYVEGRIAQAQLYSTQSIINLTRRAADLEKIFNKNPTLENWKTWQKVLKQITKHGSQDAIDAGNAIVTAEQDNAQKAAQAAKDAADKRKQIEKDAHDKILQLQKDQAEKAKQIRDQAIQDIKSSTQTIMGIYNDALQQYQGYLGTIFQGPFVNSALIQNRQQFGFALRPSDILNDMKLSVGHAENFTKSLDRLRRRGAPQELVNQIAQLGPDAQNQLNIIGRMSGAQFREWVKLFKRGQQDAKTYADRVMKDRLKQWMKFGKSVALAIAEGIKSENPALENALENTIRRMFPGLANKARTGTRSGIPYHVGETVHYHISAGSEGMGWESALRRAHFQQKNRKR
jgi:hypothetical protein